MVPARFIYKNSKNIEAAKKHFDFLTRKENLQYRIDHHPEWTNLDVTGRYRTALVAYGD